MSDIHKAVETGDLERVKALLTEDPDLVFSKDGNGFTPSQVAAYAGRKELTEMLLQHESTRRQVVEPTRSDTPVKSACPDDRAETPGRNSGQERKGDKNLSTKDFARGEIGNGRKIAETQRPELPGFSSLDSTNWIGFATRKIRLPWIGMVGIMCAVFSSIPLMCGGLPLLSSTRDPDYNMAVVTLFVGVGLLLGGVLMIMFHAMRKRRELERGELNAAGVFWNRETKETREGLFHFDIESGSMMFDKPQVVNNKPMPILGAIILSFIGIGGLAFTVGGIWSCFKGDYTGAIGIVMGLAFAALPMGIIMLNKKAGKGTPTGFKHRCHGVQHRLNRSSTTPKPVLKMVFTVKGGMTKGEFAGTVFTSRHYADLDTILFARGSITRLNGTKAKPGSLCSEIGTQLQQEVPGMVDVQVAVDRDLKNAITTQSSNAGVIGAGLGGAIGGAIGATMDQKRENAKSQEFNEYWAKVTKLFSDLKKVAETFGWTATMQ